MINKDYHPEKYDFPEDSKEVYELALFHKHYTSYFRKIVNQNPEEVSNILKYWINSDKPQK